MIDVLVVGVDGQARDALAARLGGSDVRVIGRVDANRAGSWPRADVVLLSDPDSLNSLPSTLDVGVLVLSDDVERAARMAAAGGLPAWGVLPRGAATADVRAALAAVARGLVVVPAAVSVALTRPSVGDPDEPRSPDALTRREHEVLELASQGLSNREIGAVLGISDHTVKFHLASIYGKLGASTRAEAVQRGLRSGILSL